MPATNGPGLSLTLKFFVFTALLIVLLIGGTLLFSSRKANALANQTITAGLNETLLTFDSFQKDRYAKLTLANNIILQNPSFQAYLAEADADSILDLARQNERVIKSDFIIITDADGVILARTDKPTAKGSNIMQLPLVAKALEGDSVSGLWVENQRLYNSIALPIVTGDAILGCLAVGYSIDDAVATQIKTLTHSETAFFLVPNKGSGNLIASTVSAESDLLTAYNANPNRTDAFRFHVGGEEYIGILRWLKNSDGPPLAAFLAFRSLDRELASFRQFQQSVLYVGLGTMVLAFIISFLGARRITGPLRELTYAMNEVKEGNYDVPVTVRSRDEVGVLALTFERLLSELKEKANLVQFLSKQATPARATAAVTAVNPSERTTDALPAQDTGGKSNTMASIVPGTVIGNRYEVQSVIGTGGMGVVLKARDRQLEEDVALKMLKSEVFSEDPAALERFKQEIKLARRITHRNVVRTYDYSEIDGYYCISMEYIKGITLKQLIRQRGLLPVKIGLQIGKQICSALDAAHEKGVVHRDIKPQNILLESTGDVKIMDFGIARMADVKGMTTTGTVMGTPDYMSPEQAQGVANDHRSDIYSTGVVLFEVFTGKLPFIGDPLAVLNQHVNSQPPHASTYNPQIPAELDQLILRAMQKNPGQRFQQISEVYSVLDSISVALAGSASLR